MDLGRTVGEADHEHLVQPPHSGSSLEIPRAPWTSMARITTSWSTCGAATLMAAISVRVPARRALVDEPGGVQHQQPELLDLA